MSDSSYEILCSSCRAAIPSTAKVCPQCGHALGRSVPPSPTFAAPPALIPPAGAITPGLLADGSRAYGGFWVRVGATFVDTLIVGVPLYLLVRTFGHLALVFLVLVWLYSPLMESSRSQATIGKIVFSLIVTDTSYRRISFGRAVARYFAKVLSGLPLYLGYGLVAFTPQKRALHDYIAGTLVLRV